MKRSLWSPIGPSGRDFGSERHGAEHPTSIDGYDISFTVKRGQLTTVTFTADKAGVFKFRSAS